MNCPFILIRSRRCYLPVGFIVVVVFFCLGTISVLPVPGVVAQRELFFPGLVSVADGLPGGAII
jgi:hypothetical protein